MAAGNDDPDAARRAELERTAVAARDRGDYAGWLHAREQACALWPRSVDAWMRLAYVHRYAEHYGDAHEAYARALAIDPAHLPARYAAAQLPPSPVYRDEPEVAAFERRWTDETRAMAAAIASNPPDAAQAEATLALGTNFHAHYVQRDDVAAQTLHASVVEPLAAIVARDVPTVPGPPRDGRKRIVFLSAYFRRHTIGRLFAGLVERLPRDRFDVIVVQLDGARDAATERLASRVSHLVSGNYRLPEWIALLRGTQADAFVYADVGMHPMTQALAAIRFAPRQLALWGHPVTTGFGSIDGFVSSDLFEPDDAPRHYRERLTRLPGLGAWYEPPDSPASSEPEGETPLCLIPASFYKLLPRFDRLVARIAARAPHARFLALPSIRAGVCDAYASRVREAFAAHGVDPARIEVRTSVGERDFFAIAGRTSAWLDTPRWSGGMTGIDLLSLGIPCVAFEGDTMRARQTAALLRHCGADQCIARDDDDYVERAVALLESGGQREALRNRLSSSMKSLHADGRVVEALIRLL